MTQICANFPLNLILKNVLPTNQTDKAAHTVLYWLLWINRFVPCPPDEGLSDAGATAEGRGDGTSSDGAADVGDGEGSSVPGGGEACGHFATPPATQRPG